MTDEEMIEKWLDKRMLRPKKYEPIKISEQSKSFSNILLLETEIHDQTKKPNNQT